MVFIETNKKHFGLICNEHTCMLLESVQRIKAINEISLMNKTLIKKKFLELCGPACGSWVKIPKCPLNDPCLINCKWEVKKEV